MADSSSSFTVLGALGFGSGLQVTVAGVILTSATAPAATNASVNYDGTNVVVNAPTGKGFVFAVAGTTEFTVSNVGVIGGGSGDTVFAGNVKSASGSVFASATGDAFYQSGSGKVHIRPAGTETVIAEAVAANPTTLGGQLEASHLAGGSGAVVAGDPASAGRVTIGLGAGTTSSGTAVTASGSDLAMRVGCTVNSTGTVSQPILLGSWSHNFFSPPYITATPANAATAALAAATLPFLQTTVSGWSMIANATGIPAGSYVWYLGGIAQ